ncbi:hypothetical protein KXD93_09070 [Mucilaginibacter sp. BJC16-A38]|uniref:hypothetical protein n=1 Tax=Mucilaginibacter phenanthrenivorans TaxID=1234842 RepID=UPI0021576493|nr:hypothetical protein [Mucilaginibacter phenanthrenivorans]MCR8557791.1 hypothetical protein [Mucilaginibacter phenanthrenivorans]
MKTSKNQNIKIAIVALALATSLFSCKKDSGVSPSSSSPAKISFGLKADNPSFSLASAPGLTINSTTSSASVINWTAGTANVSKFQFEAKKAGSKIEIESTGLKNINLFAIDPSFLPVKIDTGTYSEIEVKLVLAKSTSAAIPLQLKGSFATAGGTVVPVELDVNDDLVIKTEIKSVVIDATTDLKTTFMLHLNKIFSGITAADLEAATLTSGTIVISSTSNAALFNKAKANAVNIGGHEVEGEHHGHNGSDDNGNDTSGEGHSGEDH